MVDLQMTIALDKGDLNSDVLVSACLDFSSVVTNDRTVSTSLEGVKMKCG